MAPRTMTDAQKVAKFFPEFEQHSAQLADAQVVQTVLLGLEEVKRSAAERQVTFDPQVEALKEVTRKCEAARDAAVAAEATAAADLELKAGLRKAAQDEADSATMEQSNVNVDGQVAAEICEELRAEQAAGWAVAEMLGKDAAAQEAEADVEAVTTYLTGIRAEATLVAAVAGVLALKAAERGPFDLVTLESLSEVLAAKALQVEEQLALSTPAEREAKSEMLGLWALTEVLNEKLQAHGEASTQAQAAVVAAKAAVKAAKKELQLQNRAEGNLLAEQYLEGEKVEEVAVAILALQRLAVVAEAEAAVVAEAEAVALAEAEAAAASLQAAAEAQAEAAVAASIQAAAEAEAEAAAAASLQAAAEGEAEAVAAPAPEAAVEAEAAPAAPAAPAPEAEAAAPAPEAHAEDVESLTSPQKRRKVEEEVSDAVNFPVSLMGGC
ncbi:unnamed protein product [Polarella glacialis]|uniref:ATP-grasp domain-containing protein n=1 Tax=Polarella glacialis TaxID=89957 RepID=A0A813JBN2_POLGL|nr:unnamed protein product [Polarella glacialis]